MINLPFFTQKQKSFKIDPLSNYLAIDIGTEVLKTVLFKMDASGVRVKKVSRIQQQQNAMSKGVITNLNTVLENCRLAITEVTAELPPEEMPKNVVMGIAGEYIQGVSIIVNYEREEKYDRDVDFKEQDRIIAKVHQQIASAGKEDLAKRTGLVNEDIEILHITETGMEIGGMNVDSLVGFRGKSVKLYFYASFAPKTYVAALKNVTRSLGMDLVGIVSQPFAVARGFSGARNKDFSGIFIDIGGGTTDIAVVEKGSVIDTQIFAFGGRVFTKELAKELNIDHRHAEQRKIRYSEGELDEKLAGQVKKIVYPVAETWMRTLKSALEMSNDVSVFPSKIYLCGGGSLLPEIKEVMREFPWSKLLPFAAVPKVEFISPDQLVNLSDESGELKYIYDVTPASLSLFAFDKMKNPQNYNLTA
jgi:cell division protein FtsA